MLIQQRLADGKIVRVMSVGAIATPKLVEMAGRLTDIHGIWVDQEHSAVPHNRLEMLLTATRAAGIDAFSRVPLTDYGTIMRPMEAGCSGIMIAQVRTIEEVNQAVQWAKYPPRGNRGLFMANAEAHFGQTSAAEHIERANRDRWLAIQIETAEAVEIVDEIARVDEVNHLFIGPSDLSCSLGLPGDIMHPTCLSAVERVAKAAKENGVSWGTLSRTAVYARTCLDLGCQLFSIHGDFDAFRRGLDSISSEFAFLSDI